MPIHCWFLATLRSFKSMSYLWEASFGSGKKGLKFLKKDPFLIGVPTISVCLSCGQSLEASWREKLGMWELHLLLIFVHFIIHILVLFLLLTLDMI